MNDQGMCHFGGACAEKKLFHYKSFRWQAILGNTLTMLTFCSEIASSCICCFSYCITQNSISSKLKSVANKIQGVRLSSIQLYFILWLTYYPRLHATWMANNGADWYLTQGPPNWHTPWSCMTVLAFCSVNTVQYIHECTQIKLRNHVCYITYLTRYISQNSILCWLKV